MSDFFKFTYKEFVAGMFCALSGLVTGTFYVSGFYYQERANAVQVEKRLTTLETSNEEFKKAIVGIDKSVAILIALREKERKHDR